MSVEDTLKLAEINDENLAFKEADSLWLGANENESELLERRLENLCRLQDVSCRKLDRKSLKYHSKITSLLEMKGKLLGEYKYYYRAWTYLLSADWLYRNDMAEIAIDCYFRALIFQGNFASKDGGKLLFETMQAILACYRKMEDEETMNFILNDFDQKAEGMDTTYRNAYKLIRDHLKDETDLKDQDPEVLKVIENSFFAELLKEGRSMKIGVIGANGRLGTKVVREALNRGYDVRSFIVTGEGTDPREELIHKSLFDLTKEDLEGLDCVISTFGGGFHADPVINKEAFEKYAQLSEDSGLHFTVIGGAGTLYPDKTHTKHEYENMDPEKPLYNISKNICAGVEELKKTDSGHWTVVSPSQKFDFEGERHDSYRIGMDQELLYNSRGESYLTYEDMAKALVDICNDPFYERKILTVLSEI